MAKDTNKENEMAGNTFFEFHKLDLPVLEELDVQAVAIDIGYNGTKVFSQYGRHFFPSFPIAIDEDNVSDTQLGDNATDIKYRDEEGNYYFVGELAQSLVNDNETYDDSILFGRQRTESEEYLVLLRVGVALGLIKNENCLKTKGYKIKANNVMIITGLPEVWKEDKPKVVKAFSGVHNFEIKIGNYDWIPVKIEINEDEEKNDVTVISQPLGTIFSVATDVYGNITNAGLLMSNNVLVFDGGFKTDDLNYVKSSYIANGTTIFNHSMYDIYKATIADIEQGTQKTRKLRTYELENYMKKGFDVPYIVANGSKQTYNFEQDFEKNIKKYAGKVIKRMNTLYSNLQDVEYVINTGGTGEAYFPHFQSLPCTVLLAEQKESKNPAENFTPVFSNVSGFFRYLIRALVLKAKKNKKAKEDKEVAVTE